MARYLIVIISAWLITLSSAMAKPIGLPATNEEIEELISRYYIELITEHINQRSKPWVIGGEKPKRPINQAEKKAYEKLNLKSQGRTIHIEMDSLKVELKLVSIFKNQYEINGMPWTYDPSAPRELQEKLVHEILLRSLEKNESTSAWIPLLLPQAHALAPVVAGAVAVASRVIVSVGRPAVGFLQRWVWSWVSPIVKSNFAQGATGSALAMGALGPYLKCTSIGVDCPDVSDEDLKAKLASPEAEASLNEHLYFQSCANEQTPLVYEFLIEIDGQKFRVRRTLHFTKLANEDKSVPSHMTDDLLAFPGRRSILKRPVSYDFENGQLKRVRPTKNPRDLVAISDSSSSGGGGSSSKQQVAVDAVAQYIGEGYRNYDVQAATAAQRLCTIIADMRANEGGLQRDPAILEAIESDRQKQSTPTVN